MELMIGIVILGLGMVMVATIFPVAWSRARELNEYTVERAVSQGVHATITSLVRVSSPSVNVSSFSGDLLHDPFNPLVPISACGRLFPAAFATDTWVHALNLSNVQVEDRAFVDEDPWAIETPYLAQDALEFEGTELYRRSFFTSRLNFHQRVYPPMRPRDNVDANGVFDGPDDRWDDTLDTRRHGVAILYRLRSQLPYDPANLQANLDAAGATRLFDVYYVTLRRPQPTNRYARQDADRVPDPCEIDTNRDNPITVAALPADRDVVFPIPWRVQIEIPAGTLAPRAKATGIPAEVVVPPTRLGAGTAAEAMIVQMFPRGAWFIDEVSGEVYHVERRRITGVEGDEAYLTLDREIFIEDVDLPANDLRCDACSPMDPAAPIADPAELTRTVWVFPPAVEAQRNRDLPIFRGGQPVVSIDVRSLNVAPSQ